MNRLIQRIVKRPFVSLCLLSVVALAASWVALIASRSSAHFHQAKPAPKLVLPQCSLRLPKGAPGDRVTGFAPIWNTGDATLHIEKLEAGCGCASLSVSGETLEPGEKALLNVGAQLRFASSPVIFKVRIFSDDPASPAEYVVEAPVEEVLRAEPMEISFGDVPIGKSASKELRVFRAEGQNWLSTESLAVESKYGLVKAEIQPPDPAGVPSKVRVVLAKIEPKLGPGPFVDWLVLRPSYSARTVEVAIRGHIVSSILVSPSALRLDADKPPSDEPEHRFVVKRSDGKPIGRLVKVDAPAGIHVTEIASNTVLHEAITRVVRVGVAPDYHSSSERANITLRFEGENDPVSIRVYTLGKPRKGGEP